MILFLDIISPLPEFCVIDYNKIVKSKKIIQTNNEVLSDKIAKSYLGLSKYYNFNKNLKKIIVTTGPGSYTALRVGIAFICGLSDTMNLSIAGLSCEDQFNLINNQNNKNMAIFLTSSNRQTFFCYEHKKKFKYLKIDINNIQIPENINKVFYNKSKLQNLSINLKQSKFNLKKNIINNIKKIKFYKNKIIKPIYISNNKILN
tara:strand:+ start:5310 stop:5918 length:609 start_codon:yes stop_codon:yes gene_type:complete